MESAYNLENRYSPVLGAQASYTQERFVPEGPLQAELLLARVTTQLDYARQAHEALAYGTRRSRQRRNLSSENQDIATEALHRYKEMLDAYGTVTRVLQEEAATVKPKHSLLDTFHDRVLSFLQKLLLAWVERLSKNR